MENKTKEIAELIKSIDLYEIDEGVLLIKAKELASAYLELEKKNDERIRVLEELTVAQNKENPWLGIAAGHIINEI